MTLPAWNIESEDPSISSSEFVNDEQRVLSICEEIKKALSSLPQQPNGNSANESAVPIGQRILLLHAEASMLNYNLSAYTSCIESTDSKDEIAKRKTSQLQALAANYQQVFKPAQLFLCHCSEILFNQIFSEPKLQGSLFLWQQERSRQKTLLSEKEETLLAALSTSGFSSRGNLHSTLSGTIKVEIETTSLKKVWVLPRLQE